MHLKLPRSIPEEQGVSSAGILGFLEAVEKLSSGNRSKELHGFMLMRHGYVIAEGWWAPYGPERPHMLFSLSKSFTSTAIGFAVQEGILSLDDQVVSFFPKDLPGEIGENLAAMKIRHLLSMSTGHAKDTMEFIAATRAGNWARAFFQVPVEYQPGTHFLYNTGATYMLSAILQKKTGQKLIDYLRPRLFEPLGIENPAWEVCPKGINTGGFGLSIRTEDIARFGQFYLKKGIWNEKRLLSEDWVQEASSRHISNGTSPESDWEQGYGYQFWRCRHNAYRGDGAFGQYCVVIPEQDAVIVVNSGVDDMQAILNLYWDYLLPAMKKDKLPADPGAYAELKAKLSSLALPFIPGGVRSPDEGRISGTEYELDNNPLGFRTISFSFGEDACTIAMSGKKGSFELPCGIGNRGEGTFTLPPDGAISHPGEMTPASVCGAWKTDHVFATDIHLVETPFCISNEFTFDGDRLTMKTGLNVGFEKDRVQIIHGKRRLQKDKSI